MSDYHSHRVHIYYEDTDLSGVVYHANYLKYFERAREHMLGRAKLVQLLEEEGKGFVVCKCSLTFYGSRQDNWFCKFPLGPHEGVSD